MVEFRGVKNVGSALKWVSEELQGFSSILRSFEGLQNDSEDLKNLQGFQWVLEMASGGFEGLRSGFNGFYGASEEFMIFRFQGSFNRIQEISAEFQWIS